MSTHPIIAEDIRGVLSRTQSLWPDLKGASVFITGGTGFFGIWLLETLLAANREFSLGRRILALSRDSAGFAKKAPNLAHDRAVMWIAGDVQDSAFPVGPITHVIHAATESTSNHNASDPQAMFDVCQSVCERRRPGCQPRYRSTVSETIWPKSVSRPRST